MVSENLFLGFPNPLFFSNCLTLNSRDRRRRKKGNKELGVLNSRRRKGSAVLNAKTPDPSTFRLFSIPP